MNCVALGRSFWFLVCVLEMVAAICWVGLNDDVEQVRTGNGPQLCGFEATDGIEGCFEFEWALGNVKVFVLFSDGGSGN